MNLRGYSTVLISKIAILYQFFMQVSACWKASPSCMNGHRQKEYDIPLTSCRSFFLSQRYYLLKYCCKIIYWENGRFAASPSFFNDCISGPFRQLQISIHCYIWRKESFTYCNPTMNNPIECSWHVGGSKHKVAFNLIVWELFMRNVGESFY